MVSTIKFSEFDSFDLGNSSNQIVGYAGGLNYKGGKVVSWTTAGRPATPYNGLIGYNTDTNEYEFWNAVLLQWVQIASDTSLFAWNMVTALSQNMTADNGYVPNNIGQVVFTLPTTCSFGERIAVCGYGSGGWRIEFNVGQNAVLGNVIATTSTGYIESTNQFDQIELLCVVADTTFIARNIIGNLTIV